MDVSLIAGSPLSARFCADYEAELGFPTAWASGMARVRKKLSFFILDFQGSVYFNVKCKTVLVEFFYLI